MAKTRIITLMFHRVHDDSRNVSQTQFAAYLDYLTKHFPIVTPYQTLPDQPIAICLTFDDAYFDFYHCVFPLLKKYNIKALLAVSTKYIVEDTALSALDRLSVPYPQGMENDLHQEKVPFCTWKELREMADSGLVEMASHGHAHANLADPATNLAEEITYSRMLLEQKLNCVVRYFVYPYGRMTRKVHQTVTQTYEAGIRIGSSLNRGWDQKNRYLYRVDADHLWLKGLPINSAFIRKLTVKFWANRLRGK